MLVCGDLQLLHAGPRPGVARGHQYNGQLAQTLHNVIKIFEDVGANKEIFVIHIFVLFSHLGMRICSMCSMAQVTSVPRPLPLYGSFVTNPSSTLLSARSTCSIVSRGRMWCSGAILVSKPQYSGRGVITWHGPVVHGDGVHDHHGVVRTVLDHVDVAHEVSLEPANLRPVLHRASLSVRIELCHVITNHNLVPLPVENLMVLGL